MAKDVKRDPAARFQATKLEYVARRPAAEERAAVRAILRHYSPDDESARYLVRHLAESVEDVIGERVLLLAFLHEALPGFPARLFVRPIPGRHLLTFHTLLDAVALLKTGLWRAYEALREDQEAEGYPGPFGLVFRWQNVGLAVLHE
jgi:hypothetical protein